MAESVQEMSFQNVVDTILKPQGIKVGGYPDDLFMDLAEKDREKWQCNICYLVLRDAKYCDNKHKFCASCVFAWSMTYGANSDKCPVCRSKQTDYTEDVKLNREISHTWVKCPEVGCGLQCTLEDFLRHSHGMKLYEASSVGALEKAKLARRPAPVGAMGGTAEFILLPTLPRLNQPTSSGSVREGRNLLQDMMLVLHLEMELRRRALDRYPSTPSGSTTSRQERDRHMTEILAIQEQMREITGFLNILFSIPPNHSPGRNLTGPTRHGDSSSSSDESDWSDDTNAESGFRLVQPSQGGPSHVSTTRVSGNRGTLPPNATRTPLDRVRNPPSTLSSRPADIPPTLSSRLVDSSPALSTSITNHQPAAGGVASGNIDQRSSGRVAVNREVNPAATQAIQQRSRENINIRTTAANNPVSGTTTVTALDRVTEEQGESNRSAIPRPSSTFQSTLDTLPPLVDITNTGSQSTTNVVAAAAPNSPISADPISTRPGNTVAPHHRPVPPSGPGRPVNTTRIRRRVQVQANNTGQTAPSSGNDQSTRDQGNSTAQQTAPPVGRTTLQQSRAPNRLAASRRPSANRENRTSSLPTTSGALLRARRRSEIQQQIHRNMNEDEAS